MIIAARGRSRLTHFKTFSSVGAAALAALTVGCGGVAGADDTGNDPDRSAVVRVDAGGTSPAPGNTCTGLPPTGGSSCSGAPAQCVDGRWLLDTSACSCPASIPEPGTYCAGQFTTCEYAYCGGIAPLRRCDPSTRRWEELSPPGPCNTPRELDAGPQDGGATSSELDAGPQDGGSVQDAAI